MRHAPDQESPPPHGKPAMPSRPSLGSGLHLRPVDACRRVPMCLCARSHLPSRDSDPQTRSVLVFVCHDRPTTHTLAYNHSEMCRRPSIACPRSHLATAKEAAVASTKPTSRNPPTTSDAAIPPTRPASPAPTSPAPAQKSRRSAAASSGSTPSRHRPPPGAYCPDADTRPRDDHR